MQRAPLVADGACGYVKLGAPHNQLGGAALSRAELADILCEFVEVAAHSYLCVSAGHAVCRRMGSCVYVDDHAIAYDSFVREVYPAAAFERRKKYDVPVRMSRHPELNEYIAQVLKNARPWIVDVSVCRVLGARRRPSH